VNRSAGMVGAERQSLWAYYFVIPEALDELAAWLEVSRVASPTASARG
jgi:hypothetical protein